MSLRSAACGCLRLLIIAGIFTHGGSASAQGKITRVLRDVSVDGRAAQSGQDLGAGAVLRTAAQSRAELSLGQRSLVRLGSKSTLRVEGETLELQEGAVLFQAPRGRGPEIATGTFRVETSGATGMVERFGPTYVKIMLLEGTARVFLPAKVGESILLEAGHLLIAKPTAKQLPEPVDFNIGQLYRTSVLTSSQFAPLPNEAAILSAAAEQKQNPQLFPTNLVIHGRGTLVTLGPPPPAKPTASPSPSPARSRR